MITNWINKQIQSNIQQWDESLKTFYPESSVWMKDHKSYFNHLTKTCNYLNAAKLIDWDAYLPLDSKVLDMGCGGGWLTGYLSQNKKIQKIFSIDSSKNYLECFLPNVVLNSEGDISKVERVHGLFCPILMEGGSVDMIVISSALHHADNIEKVLKEFRRVLKPNAYLVVLNETPAPFFKFIYQTLKVFFKILKGNLLKEYQSFTKKISTGSYLYDPYLGDVDYPEWYWRKAIASSGFELVDLLDTNLPTIAFSKGRALKHFVCRKPA